MAGRNYPNTFADFNGETVSAGFGKINSDFALKIRENITKLLTVFEEGVSHLPKDGDYTVYTGFAGQALLYLQLSECMGDERKEEFLNKAIHLISPGLETFREFQKRKFTFLGGDGGLLAVAAVIFHKFGHLSESKDCIKKLLAFHDKLSVRDEKVCDELLYGRVGYVYCLLFVQMHIGKEALDNKYIVKVCERVLKSGQEFATSEKFTSPLMYAWHGKYVLGAAHGVTGILSILMQVPDESIRSKFSELVQPTVDYLLSLQLPSGNFLSSIGSDVGDKLVHWCHGAPGFVYMFSLAYKIFKSEKYLTAAVRCGDVVWERGLLRKGDGLCHGSAGNAYTFICLYQLTKEEKHLYRATKFTEWCFDLENHNTLKADRPYSLFEGIAGTIYFLADMLNPGTGKFPALQLS